MTTLISSALNEIRNMAAKARTSEGRLNRAVILLIDEADSVAQSRELAHGAQRDAPWPGTPPRLHEPSRPVAQLLHDAFAPPVAAVGTVGAIDYGVYAQPLTAE
jgi:hypothetical protein